MGGGGAFQSHATARRMPGRGNRVRTKAPIHPNLISMKRVVTSREDGQEEEDAEALAGDQWMTSPTIETNHNPAKLSFQMLEFIGLCEEVRNPV